MLYTSVQTPTTENMASQYEDLAHTLQPELWLTQRWTTDHRYYVAEVVQDLFGVWLVKRSWGSIGTHRGGSQTQPAADYADAVQLLRQVEKRRKARGYDLHG